MKGQGSGVRGFTLIEILVAVTIIAVVMTMSAAVVIEYIRESAVGDAFAVSASLARREIGIINTLSYSDPTLSIGYDHLTSPYITGYPYELRRTVSAVTDASGSTSNLKQVKVVVYPIGYGGTGGCGALFTPAFMGAPADCCPAFWPAPGWAGGSIVLPRL